MLSPSEHLWRFIPTEFSWTQERVALCHRAPTLSRWKLGESKPSIFRGSDPHRPHLPAPARSRALRSARAVDRKSTRLNSSHSQILYAVFCLKKKKKHTDTNEVYES